LPRRRASCERIDLRGGPLAHIPCSQPKYETCLDLDGPDADRLDRSYQSARARRWHRDAMRAEVKRWLGVYPRIANGTV